MIRCLDKPEPGRLARLAHLHRAAFEPTSRGWREDEIASLTATGMLFADAQDHGFALFSLAADEAELLTIAVHPDHQRRGLARALLQHALPALSGAGAAALHLEVAADNHPAIALYEDLRFKTTGTRRRYYKRSGRSRVDAIAMALDLRYSVLRKG